MVMLTHAIADARAWRADHSDARPSWYYPLSERCLAAFDETLRHLRQKPLPTTALRVSDYPCVAHGGELRAVVAALEQGRGFAVIEAPPERYAPQELVAVYWLVGQMLGRPAAQNVEGTL